MSERQPDQSSSFHQMDAGQDAIRYPENHVLSIVDTREQLDSVLNSLGSSGFLETEVSVACGRATADALKASTGRTGITNLVIRVATKLGLEDEESETKGRYEQALGEGKFVVLVSTPTDERKELAAQLLASHGGTFVNYLGKFSIERLGR